MKIKLKRKVLALKTWVIVLLTLYSLLVTSVYVGSSIKYKGTLSTLGEELKVLDKEHNTLSIKVRIELLEQQRQELLQEIKDIQEANKNENKN